MLKFESEQKLALGNLWKYFELFNLDPVCDFSFRNSLTLIKMLTILIVFPFKPTWLAKMLSVFNKIHYMLTETCSADFLQYTRCNFNKTFIRSSRAEQNKNFQIYFMQTKLI